MDNLVWPAKIIEKISLLPDWNREHSCTLMYICDLAKEVSGLSPSGAVSSDVAWTSFSEQFVLISSAMAPCQFLLALGAPNASEWVFRRYTALWWHSTWSRRRTASLCSPGARAIVFPH